MPRITDYSRFLSQTSLARLPSPIRALAPLMARPGMISLGGGLPNPSLFPFQKATFTLTDGSEVLLEGEHFREALQYSQTAGLQRLVNWLMQLQVRVHNPPGKQNLGIILTTGSQQAISNSFEMLINRGDHILVENPTYSGSLAALRPIGCHIHGIPTDKHGLLPSALQTKLDEWPQDQPKPKLLYLVPNGANPSGGSLSSERRHQIYALARRHDLLILEDDAYYYLQFSPTKAPSFLSLDEDGRVVRFDSFSKIVSSGLRVGYATGPKPLIDQLNLHGQASYLHPSGLSQAALMGLLDKWGLDGFLAHTDKVAAFYREKRDVFSAAAERHLKGLAEWETPQAGMFFWIKINGITDSMKLIMEKAVNKLVLMVPGSAFSPNDEPSPYVRAAFSTASSAEIDEALKRLASLIREINQPPTMSKL